VVQTDWFPESEYGVYYHLVGPNARVDTNKKLVNGPLVAEGQDIGVRIEVRSGGPATGFELVSAQLYKDKDITLGQVNTDEAVRFSASQPTLAVAAPMEISPFMIMWDPQAYPQFNNIADIGQSDAKVFYVEGDTYTEYLIGSGALHRSQVDGSYDGSPANFVGQDGKAAQAGFATSEPYLYEHEINGWRKPVKYALVNDTGYPFYPQALSIRPADKERLAPCLEKLVPIVQRAQVDFLKNPEKTNQFIIAPSRRTTPTGRTPRAWRTTPSRRCARTSSTTAPTAPWGTSRGPGAAHHRHRHPILAVQQQAPKEGLKPEDIVTNEFTDTGIGVT
jgi:hypothetical protein